VLGNIVVAEDDQMIQKLLARMIQKAGYSGHIEVCDQAESALKFIAEVDGKIDLVLVDTGLHAEGDAAFYRALKSIATQASIVASSGYSEDQLRSSKHFQDCDLAAVLSKPFGLQDIKNLLKDLSLI
jgi:DNA-binding NtrC family response regulator